MLKINHEVQKTGGLFLVNIKLFVAIQPCSLVSLIIACTLITVCKKVNFGKQNG